MLFLLPAVQLMRDWKYHDKRTLYYRRFTTGMLILYLMLVLPSALFLWTDSVNSSKMQKKIDEVVQGKDSLLSENQKLRTQMDELIKGKNDLLAKNSELLFNINEYQLDLKAKEVLIKQLEIKAKMLNRGITSSYDFNGTKRETTAGVKNTIVGREFEIFQKILELEKNGKYIELISLCEQEILITPDWLTPYYFLGIAYSYRGDKKNAIKNFEYVVDNAPNDPDYTKASEFLRKLHNQ